MKRCTDEYGDIANELKIGSVVESDIAIFTAGNINIDNKLVSMDKNKPYTIKDSESPMVRCVKSGNYAVVATSLVFIEPN